MNSSPPSKTQSRQQRLTELQLRCQFERELLARDAHEVKAGLARWDSVLGRVLSKRPSPIMIAGLTAAVLIIRPRRIVKGLRFGSVNSVRFGLRALRIWQHVQKYAPLWQRVRARFHKPEQSEL